MPKTFAELYWTSYISGFYPPRFLMTTCSLNCACDRDGQSALFQPKQVDLELRASIFNASRSFWHFRIHFLNKPIIIYTGHAALLGLCQFHMLRYSQYVDNLNIFALKIYYIIIPFKNFEKFSSSKESQTRIFLNHIDLGYRVLLWGPPAPQSHKLGLGEKSQGNLLSYLFDSPRGTSSLILCWCSSSDLLFCKVFVSLCDGCFTDPSKWKKIFFSL